MKVIAIGDIHGRTVWKRIVEREKDADKIIFIGDYLDSYDKINGFEQAENLKEIINFKIENPTKVILLFGNHDFHYIVDGERYSGYQNGFSFEYKDILNKALNKDLMQMCYVQDFGEGNGRFLFSHAGVSNVWCKKWEIDVNHIEESINLLFKYKPFAFKFSGWDPYGDDPQQSPIWVRPKSLMLYKVEGYTHVVGHTIQLDGIKLKNEPSIILIDALVENEYLVIDDGEISVGKAYDRDKNGILIM